MKRAPALAVLDFAQVPAGLDATDAMLKKAPVAFFRSGTVTRGRYLTLLGGTPASVEEALAEGLARAGGHVLDHLFLADVHPRLLDALEGRRGDDGTGALLILETATASSVVLACEKALKGTLRSTSSRSASPTPASPARGSPSSAATCTSSKRRSTS